MKYRYIERCAKGYVEFQTKDGPIEMWTDEAVEVPDALAAKLKSNNHFELVLEDDGSGLSHAEPKRRGRPPKAV